jgi:hypothetical protein
MWFLFVFKGCDDIAKLGIQGAGINFKDENYQQPL